jgi:hypothetical protein
MKTRKTVAPAFVPSGRIFILSTREPEAPAVNTVTTVPDPSLAVLAAATVPHDTFGVIGKIGAVLAGMLPPS